MHYRLRPLTLGALALAVTLPTLAAPPAAIDALDEIIVTANGSAGTR